ncbi:hypothetical protein M8J77_001765 [Diaphorina citri]|nr:hypothetical protein M8J77_001765 [Diaphorina citri]
MPNTEAPAKVSCNIEAHKSCIIPTYEQLEQRRMKKCSSPVRLWIKFAKSETERKTVESRLNLALSVRTGQAKKF